MKGLFVPGLCCRSEIWDEARTFLQGIEVLALDWPWPEEIASYDDGARWLANEIAAHRPHFVVGHSLGGLIALHLRSHLQAPPDWRLVIVDTFLVTPHPFFRNHVWQPAPALRDRVATMLAEERPRFPILRQLAASEDLPQWPARLLTPRATYIYGGRSDAYSAASLGEMAGVPASSGHDVHTVPGTSHFPMLERPDAFSATLADILQAADAPRKQ